MRKHGGTPSRRDKHVTLAAISPPGVARGRFVGGQQSGLAGCKPPPLFTRGASSCSSQGRRQGEPWGASPRPSAPTYLPTQWGWRKGVPGGGAFHRCEGRVRSGAPPPPTTRSLGGLLGSATHVLWARACGFGGPTLSPWPACPVGAACHGDGGGPSPGGVACHRCEGGLVSGAVSPPAVRPLGRVAGVPQPRCLRCGPCWREDPAPAPQRVPLRVGIARCGSGRRESPRGVLSTVMRGV